MYPSKKSLILVVSFFLAYSSWLGARERPERSQAGATTANTAADTPVGQPSTIRVRVTITALGPHRNEAPPLVSDKDVLLYQENERRPVLEWVPAQGSQAGLDLAILVDDSLDTTLGLQLGDLSEFIRSLPPTTRVGIFYGHNGMAEIDQDFTPEHESAVKALRVPFGGNRAFSSVYLSLIDLLKRWPGSANRREVLLITDGIDLFRGVAESAPGANLDLDRAIDQAQREGVIIHNIYARGAGRLRRNFFLVSNGQSSLARLAAATGGESFYQGFETPISFKPFLQELQTILSQQYLLTFSAQLGKKGRYEHLRVTTELPHVELIAPDKIFIPAGP